MTLVDSETANHGIAAKIYADLRTDARFSARRPITLRTFKNEPIDAVVEDLSRGGFAVSTLANIELGATIGLSVGGVFRRKVRVVRRVGLVYGCEFLSPLSDSQVKAALRSGDIVLPEFVRDTASPDSHEGQQQSAGINLSFRSKAYIVGGLISSLWMILVLVLRHASRI